MASRLWFQCNAQYSKVAVTRRPREDIYINNLIKAPVHVIPKIMEIIPTHNLVIHQHSKFYNRIFSQEFTQISCHPSKLYKKKIFGSFCNGAHVHAKTLSHDKKGVWPLENVPFKIYIRVVSVWGLWCIRRNLVG